MELQPEDHSERPVGKVNRDIYRIKSPLEQLEALHPNNLDEGIIDSLWREIKEVGYKFGYVLLPRSSDDGTRRLRNWDLWGPFAMALLFMLVVNNNDQFILLLISMFGGAMIVTFNLRILGGTVSFLQSVAILGYCTFPLFMMLIFVHFLKFIQVDNSLVKFIIIVVGVLWSVLACRAFIAANLPEDRKFVAMYPIFLFYIFIGTLLFQV